jgi:hypothetical protein
MSWILQGAFGFAEIDLKFRVTLFSALDLRGKHTSSHQTPITGAGDARSK